MDRMEFEELVSQWLDDRQDAALRGKIEAACAADPACRELLAQYEKLDGFIRDAAGHMPAVDWPSLKLATAARITHSAAAGKGADLDSLLREALPSIETRVNWNRYAQHVSRAVDRSTGIGRVLRISHWRSVAALAGLAAAAALILWVALPMDRGPASSSNGVPVVVSKPPLPGIEKNSASPDSPSGVPAPAVVIRTVEPGRRTGAAGSGAAVAHALPRDPAVQVCVTEQPRTAPAVAQAVHGASEPEVFFMLEPPNRTALASAAGFGSH